MLIFLIFYFNQQRCSTLEDGNPSTSSNTIRNKILFEKRINFKDYKMNESSASHYINILKEKITCILIEGNVRSIFITSLKGLIASELDLLFSNLEQYYEEQISMTHILKYPRVELFKLYDRFEDVTTYKTYSGKLNNLRENHSRRKKFVYDIFSPEGEKSAIVVILNTLKDDINRCIKSSDFFINEDCVYEPSFFSQSNVYDTLITKLNINSMLTNNTSSQIKIDDFSIASYETGLPISLNFERCVGNYLIRYVIWKLYLRASNLI